MIIKKKKEDFIVEEVNSFQIKQTGNFKLYSLKKQGIETIQLIAELERNNDISRKFIGIGGIKDKNAITTQYLSIPSKYDFKSLHGEGYSIKFLGYINEPIEVGSLSRNKFTLTLRELNKNDLIDIDKKIKFAKEIGILNYFDSQRFGSVIDNVFIAKFLIKEDYENALKQYFLTQFNSHNATDKILFEKKDILKNWKNFENLKLNHFEFKRIQTEYIRTKSFRCAYKMIPSKLREMFVISYQSYLWNECIKEYLVLSFNKKDLFSVKYAIDELYYLNYNLSDISKIKEIPINFTTIGRNFTPTDIEKKIYEIILKRENITYDELKKVSKSGSFLRSQERKTLIKPINLTIGKEEKDNLSKDKVNNLKIKISFELEKGAYATNIIKGIFGK